jgi:ABC-type sugar transport system ATPase subunit
MKRLLPTPGNPEKKTRRRARAMEASAASKSLRLVTTMSWVTKDLAGHEDAEGIVDVVEPRGSEQLLYVRPGTDGGRELRVIAPPDVAIAPEQAVGLRLDPARLHRFDASTGRRVN